MIRTLIVTIFALSLGLICTHSEVGAQEGTTLTDVTGYEHTVRKPPTRIVSLIPSNTELLFVVGAGKAVVGVTDYCNYPPEVKEIEKIGDLMTLSVETIVALKPDLVLATGDNPDEPIRSLRELGINVFVIDPQTVEGVIEALKTVGILTGHRAQALDLVQDIKSRISVLNKKLGALPADRRPTVFVGSPQRTENWTPGPGTFSTDVIQRAGGRNISDELKSGTWGVYSLEKIVAKNPEVILSTVHEAQDVEKSTQSLIALAKGMSGWKNIRAIKNGRVVLLPEDWLLRPTPRMIKAIEQLAQMLHPELFQ